MRFFLSIFAFLLVCFFSPVYPHAILVEPKARNGQAIDPGIKIPQPQGPTAAQLLGCGGTQGADPGPGTIAATYTAGQSIRVSWDVTIPHSSPPGVRIALKYSDTDSFDKNLIVSGVDVDSNKNAANNIAWTTITLPAGKTSQNAVLQWIWHSTSDGGYYIACSDIRINAATGGGGGATTTTAAPTTRTTATTTTADPDAETTETPTTEGPETTEPAITEEPEETTTTRRIQTSTSRQSTGTTSSGTRTTTSTTRRPYSTNPLIGQQQVGPANAATNGRNTVIAFIMASVMAAFMRLFH